MEMSHFQASTPRRHAKLAFTLLGSSKSYGFK